MAMRIRVNLAPFPLRLRPFRDPRKLILAGSPPPLKAGLRPPPPAANGLNRGWLCGTDCRSPGGARDRREDWLSEAKGPDHGPDLADLAALVERAAPVVHVRPPVEAAVGLPNLAEQPEALGTEVQAFFRPLR